MANLPPPQEGVDVSKGHGFTWLNQAYQAIRQLIAGSNQALINLTTASGIGYTAPYPGMMIVTGGLVTSITLSRSGTNTNLVITSGSILVSQGDIITIVYSAIPTMLFIPR